MAVWGFVIGALGSLAWGQVVRAQTPTAVSQTGPMYLLWQENLVQKVLNPVYYIKMSGRALPVSVSRTVNVPSGSTVTAKLTLQNKQLAVANKADGTPDLSLVKALAANATGAKKIAIIRANFNNLSATTPTNSEIANVVSTQLAPFYAENSFGRLSLTADVYGPVNLPIAASCDMQTIERAIITAADAQVNYLNYQLLMYVYPGNCANVGQAWAGNSPGYPSSEGTVSLPSSGILNTAFGLFLTAHEMGHNFTGFHGNGWDCGTTQTKASCPSLEYADAWDVLGGGYSHHFSAYHKSKFGWFTSGNLLTTSAGEYTLNPIESLNSGLQVLRVPRNASSYYYIENRQTVGYDNDLPESAVAGAVVRIAPDQIGTGDSHLVDAHPGGTGDDFFDAGVGVGEAIVDSVANKKISVISKDGGLVRVKVGTVPTPTTAPTPTPLPAPTLNYPPSGVGTSVNVTRPLFDWTDVPGATNYTFQVARDQNFTSLVLNLNLTVSSYKPTADLPRGVLLFWRVRAVSGTKIGLWSRYKHFTSANPPSVPVLLSPANNALVSGLLPTLDWSDSTGNPTYYEVSVAKDAAFTSLLGRGQGGKAYASMYTFTTSLQPGTTYYWKVRAVRSVLSGIEYSEPSLVRSFRTP